MKTIDLTPTWEQALVAFLLLFESGNQDGRVVAMGELKRMAKLADLYVASQKSQEKGQ